MPLGRKSAASAASRACPPWNLLPSSSPVWRSPCPSGQVSAHAAPRRHLTARPLLLNSRPRPRSGPPLRPNGPLLPPSVRSRWPTTYRVPWRLEHDGGSAYRLLNDSDETAEAATLTCGSAVQSGIIVVQAQPQDVQPHSAIPFVDARALRQADEPLIVTWRRPGEDTPRTWKCPIPFSP